MDWKFMQDPPNVIMGHRQSALDYMDILIG